MRRRNIIMGLVAALLIVAACVVPAFAGNEEYDAEKYLASYHFELSIDGIDEGIFNEVEGLNGTVQVIEYQNGDDPLTRKRPGRVTYGNVTLTRPYTPASDLHDRIAAMLKPDGEYKRSEVEIELVDAKGSSVKKWYCYECFPARWELTTLDAKGDDVLYEQIEIVVEYFEES